LNQIFEDLLYEYQRSPDQDHKELVHHRVLIVGAGPVGLSAAIDLAIQGIEVLVIDESEKVSTGSRAICVSKRTLEISDRLGIGKDMLEKGIMWNLGKVLFDRKKIYEFNLLPEIGHQYPAFINLQQYYVEEYLVSRIRYLQSQGYPIEIRGKNRVEKVTNNAESNTKLPNFVFE
jgi:3-(3-hydroxy-phenyl)propionate hydroxylase